MGPPLFKWGWEKSWEVYRPRILGQSVFSTALPTEAHVSAIGLGGLGDSSHTASTQPPN